MSDEVEDRSLQELSDLEGEKEQFSTFEHSKIKYTKAFLLEFDEVRFCSKLPRDFDLLILRELGDASDGRMPCNSSLYGPLPPTRWNVGLPENGGAVTQCLPGDSGYNAIILGPRIQKNELFQLKKSENPYRPPHCHKVDNAKYEVTPSMKETDLLENKASWQDKSWLELHTISSVGNCESKNADIDVLDENDAAFIVSEDFVAQENDEVKRSDADLVMDSSNFEDTGYKYSRTSSDNLFSSDLHTNNGGTSNAIRMMPQLLDARSEHGMEFSVNSSFSAIETGQKGLVDSTTANDNFEYGFRFPDVDDFLNSILGDCEASWRNNERSKKIAVADRVETGMIKDNECTSDDDWAEISQILQLERVYDDIPDSEIESCLPDEDSLILVSQSTISTRLNFGALGNCNHVAHSDTEISWPDEDSLISVDDLIAPQIWSSLNRNSKEADNLTSNLAVNITKNLEALTFTKLDKGSVASATRRPKVQPFLDVSGLITRGKLHTQQSQSQTSDVIFGQNRPSLYPGNDQPNYPAKYKTPNITCYIPSVNCYACSNSDHQAFQGTTVTNLKANDSLRHYSLLQQPHVRPQQQNQRLIDSTCTYTNKQVAASDLSTMQFFPWTSQQMTYQGFEKSSAVLSQDPAVIGDLGDQNASGIINADALLYCGRPSSRSRIGPGTLPSQ